MQQETCRGTNAGKQLISEPRETRHSRLLFMQSIVFFTASFNPRIRILFRFALRKSDFVVG